MLDERLVDRFLRNDPDVSIIDDEPEFVYTLDVSVDGLTGAARIWTRATTTCLIFTTESVQDNLGEAFQASEQVANVALAPSPEGEVCLRSAILRDASLPMAVTNTLQALALVKIRYDELVAAIGPTPEDPDR